MAQQETRRRDILGRKLIAGTGKYKTITEPSGEYVSKRDAWTLFLELGPGRFRLIARNINTGQVRTYWTHREPL